MPNRDQQNSDKQFMAMPIVCWCVDWLVAAKNAKWRSTKLRQTISGNANHSSMCQLTCGSIHVEWRLTKMRWTIPGNANCSSTRWLLNYFQLLQEHCLPNLCIRKKPHQRWLLLWCLNIQESATFSIVTLIQISISEGARFAPVNLPAFTDGDWIAPQRAASKLIVIYINYKISLHFHEDCGIFCEGEWEQSQQLTQIFDDDSNAAISQWLIGLGQTGLVGLVGHIGSVNRNGSVNHNGLVGWNDLNDHIGLVSVKLSNLVDRNNFVNHIGLVGLNDLVHFINHNGLIGQISLISLIGISGFSLLGGFGLVSLIDFSGLISPNGLVSFDSLVAAIIAAAEFLVAMATQAAAAKTHGVAIKLASTTKITNAAIWYYCAALLLVLLLLIWRESGLWCEWRVFFSLAGLDSVFENASQNVIFSVRIPVMTKYCVMRECENIL
jgi:hypothetical protein